MALSGSTKKPHETVEMSHPLRSLYDLKGPQGHFSISKESGVQACCIWGGQSRVVHTRIGVEGGIGGVTTATYLWPLHLQ